MAHQEEEEREINERKEKLEKFIMYCLEDWIMDHLLIWEEKIQIIALSKPEYNEFDKHLYSKGLLKVGRKYLPLSIEAGGILILIKAKPMIFSLTWADLEKELMYCRGRGA